jgi:hypothetical protein
MSSVIAAGTSRGARHAKKAVTIAAAMAALTVGAGCVDDRNQPSNQATGTVVGGLLGGAVGGLAFGSVGGVWAAPWSVRSPAIWSAGRSTTRERQRPAATSVPSLPDQPTDQLHGRADADGTASASTTSANATTGSAQPTVVSAKPVGAPTAKPDGSTCRPIELTATKNGQTTTQTTTFCQAAGSTDLKPVSV